MGEYNLTDENWIPTDKGLKSLKDIFNDTNITLLSGNPIEKISILKLLLAIAQRAYTPIDDDDWQDLGVDGLSKKCLEYLDKWYDKFYLFGDEPFLQMKVDGAKKETIKKLDPIFSSDNNSVIFYNQLEREYKNHEKAMLLLVQMGFSFSRGKKNGEKSKEYNSGFFLGNYKTPKTPKYQEDKGFIHSFFIGSSILDTIYLNLFCEDTIKELYFFEKGIGIPAWEKMPESNTCNRANEIKNSFIGCLIPMCRFIYLDSKTVDVFIDNGIVYDKSDYIKNTTITQINEKNFLHVELKKKPWRQLPAILQISSQKYGCLNINTHIERNVKYCDNLILWVGGLQVKNSDQNDQNIKGNNDYLESLIKFSKIDIDEIWYEQFKLEMNKLENLEYQLKKSIEKYYEVQKEKDLSNYLYQFWELCEKHLNELLIACNNSNTSDIRKKFANIAYSLYDSACPKNSARQITIWAKNRPSFYKYINGGE